MTKTVSNTVTIWDIFGFTAFCASLWFAWNFFQTPIYTQPNPEAARSLLGLLTCMYLGMVFWAIRFKAWFMLLIFLAGTGILATGALMVN